MFSVICAWINGWVNNREVGDSRRYRAHYDAIVMVWAIKVHYQVTNWHLCTLSTLPGGISVWFKNCIKSQHSLLSSLKLKCFEEDVFTGAPLNTPINCTVYKHWNQHQCCLDCAHFLRCTVLHDISDTLDTLWKQQFINIWIHHTFPTPITYTFKTAIAFLSAPNILSMFFNVSQLRIFP